MERECLMICVCFFFNMTSKLPHVKMSWLKYLRQNVLNSKTVTATQWPQPSPSCPASPFPVQQAVWVAFQEHSSGCYSCASVLSMDSRWSLYCVSVAHGVWVLGPCCTCLSQSVPANWSLCSVCRRPASYLGLTKVSDIIATEGNS